MRAGVSDSSGAALTHKRGGVTAGEDGNIRHCPCFFWLHSLFIIHQPFPLGWTHFILILSRRACFTVASHKKRAATIAQ